jgi:RNA polymerase sigma factor (sigma-70 family)
VDMNIVNEVAALQRLSVGQLRQRFAEVFGEVTAASNRTWLIKRIAWRMQALAEGDLSQRARQRAAELARDADLRLNPPQDKTTTPPAEPIRIPTPVNQRLPPPGTILVRPYKGLLVQVQVLTDGFALFRSCLSLAQRRGQSRHRQPHQQLPLLPQLPQPPQGERMTRSRIMGNVDTPRRPAQAVPADPAALWDVSKPILFHVAKKVRQAVRLQLQGHGRGQAEAEELVHDAFLCVVEALPRFDPAAAKLTTFVYGLARRRMWLVARAAFYGLSPEQLHRMDTAKRTPRYHRGERTLGVSATRQEDASARESVRCVAAIQQRLPVKDRRLITLYVQEGGNYSAAARRLGRDSDGIRDRYHRLFRRIRAATARGTINRPAP